MNGTEMNESDKAKLMAHLYQQHQSEPHPGLTGKRLRIHLALHAVVEQQIQDSSPPETLKTVERLKKQGLMEAEKIG